MQLEPQCVVCARPLRFPRRADRRYCGSSCRVRAFRAREKRQLPTSTAIRNTPRAPRRDVGSIVGSTRMQLTIFRELRQARKHAAELAAQLTQAKKAAEQQRREHDQERQLLQESLAAARQQSALLETALVETQTLAATQLEADAQTAQRLTTEKCRAVGRIDELEKEASVAAVAYQKTVEQLQDALQGVQRELATVDAARVTAEARSQSLDAVLEELDAEKKRNAALLDKLAELWNSNNAQRAEHERELMEARQQTATEGQQTNALRVSLREAMATVRKQRDQLDNTALSLTMARAAIDLRVNQAKLEKLNAELLTAQKELASRTTERDGFQEAVQGLIQLLAKKQGQLTSAEEELSKHKALLVEHQAARAELTNRTVELLERLLRIRTHKDWRL